MRFKDRYNNSLEPSFDDASVGFFMADSDDGSYVSIDISLDDAESLARAILDHVEKVRND